MTKRYMDFAPKKTPRSAGARRVASGKKATGVTVKRPTVAGATVKRPAARTTATRTTSVAKTAGVAKSTIERKPTVRAVKSVPVKPTQKRVKLGEIEDLSPKFVMTDVPKRALGDNTNTATVAKAQKVGNRAKVSKKIDTTEKMRIANEKKKTYAMPRAPFINQDKVAKRPLSKNVYRRSVVKPSKEITSNTDRKTKKGEMVTIISKPEKDSKVGVIVTIVLTIILGAVAGTVAFLLLPK